MTPVPQIISVTRGVMDGPHDTSRTGKFPGIRKGRVRRRGHTEDGEDIRGEKKRRVCKGREEKEYSSDVSPQKKRSLCLIRKWRTKIFDREGVTTSLRYLFPGPGKDWKLYLCRNSE